MKEFEYYLKKGDVRRVSQNVELAKSLKKDLFERVEKVNKLDLKKYPKIIFENIYDSLREFCDFLLALDSYKSYSHEASISYLKKYKFNDADISELDMFRYKRNSSKYYGKKITDKEVEEIRDFYFRILNKIKTLTKEKIK